MTRDSAYCASFIDELRAAALGRDDYHQAMAMVGDFGTDKDDVNLVFDVMKTHKNKFLLEAFFNIHWSSLKIIPDHLQRHIQVSKRPYPTAHQNMVREAVWNLIVGERRSWLVHALVSACIPPDVLYDLRPGQLGQHLVWALFGLDYTSTTVKHLDNPFEALDLICAEQHRPYWGEGCHPLLMLANGSLGRDKMKTMVKDHTSYDLRPYLTTLLSDPNNPHLSVSMSNVHDVVGQYNQLGIDLSAERYQALLKKFTQYPIGIAWTAFVEKQDKAFELLQSLGNQLWVDGGMNVAEQILNEAVSTNKNPRFVNSMLNIFPAPVLRHVADLHHQGRWNELSEVMAQHPLIVAYTIERSIDVAHLPDKFRRM